MDNSSVFIDRKSQQPDYKGQQESHDHITNTNYPNDYRFQDIHEDSFFSGKGVMKKLKSINHKGHKGLTQRSQRAEI
jgi:hypothetical protein